MKTPVLFFVAGGAAGAVAMWLIQSSEAPETRETTGGKPVASALRTSEKEEKLAARVQALEKELKAAKEGSEDSIEDDPIKSQGKKAAKMIRAPFGDEQIEEMMRKNAEREVSREVDRVALRLKLTPEQKESLRKFLTERKEQEHTSLKAAMKGGAPAEVTKRGQSKDEFLKTLLTPEQQADYARSQEEQRTAKAEEYAQRKVRKLNNELNLSEEQKDKLFQAYAQQKLTPADPAKKEPSGDVTGTIAFATVGASIGDGGPVEFEFDGDALLGGNNKSDIDRATVESILTPEQLAVYDQRKAEEQEQMKNVFRLEGGEAMTKSLKIRVEKPAPAPDGQNK
jgi:hypothetical protein